MKLLSRVVAKKVDRSSAEVTPSEKRKISTGPSPSQSDNPREVKKYPLSPPRASFPLGSGSLNSSGSAVSDFVPSPERASASVQNNTEDSTMNFRGKQQKKANPSLGRAQSDIVVHGTPKEAEAGFNRSYSSFLRVADLQMDETVSLKSASEDSLESSFPNYHHISVDPPPGVEIDIKERWVVLDDGDGNHAPIAPLAVKALARSGLASSFDTEMWTPDGKTAKILKTTPAWGNIVWQMEGAASLPDEASFSAEDILVWSGTFKHGHYGSELPAIRSCGIIDVSPQALIELLVDSSRVKEYNKLSLGRTDMLVLQEGMEKNGAFGGVTKVMKTESKPPVIRKTLRFTSLLHARELEDGSGYKMVTRAVTLPEEKEDLANALKSEILLGATIIKRVEGNDNRCLLVSVNHLRSPMVPMMIAKRIGLQAASGFIQDLRACCN